MSSIIRKGDHLQYPLLRLEAQGSVFAVASSMKRVTRPVGGKRGIITEFSKASRKRLIRKIARLKPVKITFVTLTYPGEYPDVETAKAHQRALLERIRRRCPETSGIWRLEFQQRGAPHFHWLLFNLPYISFETLKSWWQEVIGVIDSVPVFVRIEQVRSWRGVMSYASKYLAKLSEPRAAPFFNFVAYLHAKRCWGVFNAQFLPFNELVKAAFRQVTPVALKHIKEVCAQIWAGCDPRDLSGFVVLSDSAYDLYLLACRLALDDLPYSTLVL